MGDRGRRGRTGSMVGELALARGKVPVVEFIFFLFPTINKYINRTGRDGVGCTKTGVQSLDFEGLGWKRKGLQNLVPPISSGVSFLRPQHRRVGWGV